MAFDLHAERMNRGITLKALAQETGVSRATLIRVEHGSRPQAPVAAKIAAWVGAPASELWPRELKEAA